MRYKYTGWLPTIFLGLRHGVEAIVHPGADPDGQVRVVPDGSTVTLHPGDEVQFPEPFDHRLLQPIPDPPGKAAKSTKPESGQPADTTEASK